ncbi:MAG: hypothetical protein RR091_06595 [Cloacibacillus sp.]
MPSFEYPSGVRFALENFIKAGYVELQKENYLFEEGTAEGASKLAAKVRGVNICICNVDAKHIKCPFVSEEKSLGLKKSVDHIIFQCDESGVWHLHLLEMKTTVGTLTWHDIKQKVRASYMDMKAFAVFLGIDIRNENIHAYTTFENAKSTTLADTTNPSLYKAPLGKEYTEPYPKEWNEGFINMDFDAPLRISHKKIQMTRSTPKAPLESSVII